MPLDKSIQKVLVIGSGPIVIGQAAEFDYAGAAGLPRAEGCRHQRGPLSTPTPPPLWTDQAMADEIYLSP
ncbi:MAG: hypothetical protein ACLTG0_09045 [Oscillibacter sp.]